MRIFPAIVLIAIFIGVGEYFLYQCKSKNYSTKTTTIYGALFGLSIVILIDGYLYLNFEEFELNWGLEQNIIVIAWSILFPLWYGFHFFKCKKFVGRKS